MLPISAAILFGYLLTVVLGDRIPAAMSQYMTAIPFKFMFIGLGLSLVMGAALYSGLAALLFGMAWHYAARTFGEDRIPGWSAMPAAYYRDALWIGLGGTAIRIGLKSVLDTVELHLPLLHRSFPSAIGGDFDSLFPAGAIVGQVLMSRLVSVGLLALLAAFIASELRSLRPRIPLFFLGVLALLGNWGSNAELVFKLLSAVLWLTLIVWGVVRVARFNLLGCFLVLAGASLIGAAATLLAQPNPYYRANGYGVLLVLGLFYVWVALTWRAKSSPNQDVNHSQITS